MEKSASVASGQVRESVKRFIVENFLFGDAGRMPAAEASLIENGIIDSTGILELIEFIEAEYGIEIDQQETTPQNLDSVENIARFVERKAAAIA